MSYQQSAEYINKDLKSFIRFFRNTVMDEEKERQLLNTIIKFGQIAKFRCRNNTAYDNFVNQCFKDIAKTERRQEGETDFRKLQVVEMIK